MSAFQLDTSGYVRRVGAPENWQSPMISWPDHSPFVQGYARRALESLWEELEAVRQTLSKPNVVGMNDQLAHIQHLQSLVRYDHLASETVARIMEDCESFCILIGARGRPDHNQGIGRRFWDARQARFSSLWSLHQNEFAGAFPPQTVFLNDDGKVVFG